MNISNSSETVTYQLCHTYHELSTSKSSLNLFYANVRSICSKGKFDELKCVIKSINCILHVILLTETWLKSPEEAERYQIPNYTHYYNIRTDSRGGGVSIYVHNNVNHSLNEEIYTGGVNYLWVHIEKCALNIGVI